jgi:3-hydroxymyristoyl/3-hydroxydecanoyl-(acyl carrier protein) dehydratase
LSELGAGLPPLHAGRFSVPAAHPALPGHFPGHPIVPGVVLLDHVLGLIRAALPGGDVPPLTSAKFLAVVLPEREVVVHCGPAESRIAFACTMDGAVVLRGQLG